MQEWTLATTKPITLLGDRVRSVLNWLVDVKRRISVDPLIQTLNSTSRITTTMKICTTQKVHEQLRNKMKSNIREGARGLTLEAASKQTKPMLKSTVRPMRWLSMMQAYVLHCQTAGEQDGTRSPAFHRPCS